MQAVCVVIYGASLVLAAIEAGLKGLPEFNVIRVNPQLPIAIEQVHALQPQVIIVDGRYDYSAFCPSTILRVDRNANNQSAVINDKHYPIGDLTELVEVIMQFKA